MAGDKVDTKSDLRRVEIAGSGVHLPSKVVESCEIDKENGYSYGFIEEKTGVYSRHYATSESASDIAIGAIHNALKDARVSLDSIDCLIAASGTAEQAIPCNAAIIHSKLDFNSPVPAFDINMTCLSALMALDMASLMIQAGQYKTIIIVSSDIASVGLGTGNSEIDGLFGDGAACLILRHANTANSGFHKFNFRTYSEGVSYCQIRGGGSLNHPSKITGNYSEYGLFEMKGKEVYRLTASVIDSFINETLESCGLTINDISWVVPHQASKLAISHLQKRLDIDPNKVINILRNNGNQIAVSIPAAFHALRSTKKCNKGDKILFIGTSAGLSVGAAILEI